MSKEFTSRHPNREQSTILIATKTIKRSGFEELLKKWTNQDIRISLIPDIYDSE
ncbi:8248_t:CDS:2, partial [Funneliformis caledonium]